MATKADRYEGIDGLKAYAIIGIALMHVLANGEYGIGGFVFERLIPSFTNLVFLFMMVSGFGMCCGYYQKIVDQKISVEDFYKKRYIKIWPYFRFCDFAEQGILVCGFRELDVMSRASAECQDFGHWCELDAGSHFCVLYAVPILLLPDWKQEESMECGGCGTGI